MNIKGPTVEQNMSIQFYNMVHKKTLKSTIISKGEVFHHWQKKGENYLGLRNLGAAGKSDTGKGEGEGVGVGDGGRGK